MRPTRYDHPDAVALTALAQRYYAEIYGDEDTNPISPTEFVPPHGEFLVGYLEGEAVAMGGWRRLHEEAPVPAVRPGEIRRMFVSPQRRRLGLARQLLAALETSASDAGVDVLLLETGQPQAEAVALYRNSGYLDAPRFGYYADSGLAVHLARRLPDRVAGRPCGVEESAASADD